MRGVRRALGRGMDRDTEDTSFQALGCNIPGPERSFMNKNVDVNETLAKA